MQLTEQHIITKTSPFYKEIDDICFKSKNLYNSSLYAINKAFENDGSNIVGNIYHIMKDSEQYKALPAKISALILIQIQKNYKSYFNALKDYNKNPSKYKARPQAPKYKPKVKGRYMVTYTNQAISRKIFKASGKIKLSLCGIEFYTKVKEFNQLDCVRIVPKLDQYVIEVVYTIPDVQPKVDNNRYMAIDLGVNNLATVVCNDKTVKPIAINGRPLKSINQYYNKQYAKRKSTLEKKNNKKSSKYLKKLTNKRNNKVDDYLHKSSKHIIQHCIDNNVNTLVIGKNDNWKQDINIGKVNNQNFVQIPHSRFIEMISYKCEKQGINVILQEESYTSKASFLDLDFIPTYNKSNQITELTQDDIIELVITTNKGKVKKYVYGGYRKCRGMYKSKKYGYINADVNGGYNTMRKAIPEAFVEGIEGVVVHPLVIIPRR